MAAKKEYKMSAERQQELKDELNYLKTVREKEVAELIKEARGFGDLSENSEYDEAKNEQGKLYSRIAEVEEILLHAVVVSESDDHGNTVSIGCMKCKKECPADAITVENFLAVIDQDKCVHCGHCADICPRKCIKDIA